MSVVEIAPTTADDVKEFFPEASPWRIRALTVRIDGKVKGIGGYAVLPDGSRMAFLEAAAEDCARYPVTLQKAARRFFEELKDTGVVRMVARCDRNRAAAVRWLVRLGFTYLGEQDGESIFQWRQS